MDCKCSFAGSLDCKSCASKPLEWKIYELIRRLNHVSFSELEKLEGFAGDCALRTEHENVVLWNNCSRQAADTMVRLLEEKKIEMKQVELIVYMIDGHRLPTLPVAKSNYNYKKPRWLPVTFQLPK